MSIMGTKPKEGGDEAEIDRLCAQRDAAQERVAELSRFRQEGAPEMASLRGEILRARREVEDLEMDAHLGRPRDRRRIGELEDQITRKQRLVDRAERRNEVNGRLTQAKAEAAALGKEADAAVQRRK